MAALSTDYIVAGLPPLVFGERAPMAYADFAALAPHALERALAKWADLETQLKNAVAEARGGAKYVRAAHGCSLYWKKRVTDAYAETDFARRDELLDRVWWDAAGELTAVADPLGEGALATYAVRLKLALKRGAIDAAAGDAAFTRLTAETQITF